MLIKKYWDYTLLMYFSWKMNDILFILNYIYILNTIPYTENLNLNTL